MVYQNARGQYGYRPLIGAAMRPSESSASKITPWLIGGVGVAAICLALFATHAAKRPRLSDHEKEIREWKAEFPGLPWYMDEVKDARQLDMWERARDHWERTH